VRRAIGAVLVFLLACVAPSPASAEREIERGILALFDGRQETDAAYTRIHRLLEMPLNHLGLVVTYHDLRQPLPPLEELKGYRGIVAWFIGDAMPQPTTFIAWANRAMDSGKKLVLLGSLGFANDHRRKPTPVDTINPFLRRLGIVYDQRRVEFAQDVRIVHQDRRVIGFERPLPRILPPYDRMVVADRRVRPLLVAREGDDASTDSILVATHPNGGFVAEEYIHHGAVNAPVKQYYVNPFEFLRLAFATDDLPKPDTTSLVGRRIYYSHIDGDGWRNVSNVKGYAETRAISAEVIMREAIEAFPDLPVTVAPIVGDLHPDWYGGDKALAIAKALFRLPQVEVASHTWSHPLDWGFFAADDPRNEVVSAVSNRETGWVSL
jgi:hypothetical protein